MSLTGLVLSVSFISCGLSDDPPQDAGVYDLDNLNGGCELNTERLNKILEEDVSKDIYCLESNLDQFVQFVRRENPNLHKACANLHTSHNTLHTTSNAHMYTYVDV